jgi:hypothetical protein
VTSSDQRYDLFLSRRGSIAAVARVLAREQSCSDHTRELDEVQQFRNSSNRRRSIDASDPAPRSYQRTSRNRSLGYERQFVRRSNLQARVCKNASVALGC